MRFEVETSSLNTTVQNMESELVNIMKIRGKLYAALEALDGMWVGAAHDTFAAQYLADQKMLNDMGNAISQVIDGMDNARRTYDQCEATVSAEIRKISV